MGGKPYFQENFYYRSDYFSEDDERNEPLLPLSDKDCPIECCKNRRMCMRTHDVMEYKIPFNSVTMLVFGGRTYRHQKDSSTGKLVYHHCEEIPQQQLLPEWRSCTEEFVNELWRYDIQIGKWEVFVLRIEYIEKYGFFTDVLFDPSRAID